MMIGLKAIPSSALVLTGLITSAHSAVDVPPQAVIVDGIVDDRPLNDVTGRETKGPWRRIVVHFKKEDIYELARKRSYFSVATDDCRGALIAIDSAYVNSTPLQKIVLSFNARSIIEDMPEPVSVEIFILETQYKERDSICGVFEGGSLLFAGQVTKYPFRIK